jgi:hypothetical protein
MALRVSIMEEPTGKVNLKIPDLKRFEFTRFEFEDDREISVCVLRWMHPKR